MTPTARTFRIRGRVQGVGFRWWARSLAVRLELRGTVRNLQDGSVELRAFGEPTALAALGAELKHGPPGAVVETVEDEELEAEAPAEFSIAG